MSHDGEPREVSPFEAALLRLLHLLLRRDPGRYALLILLEQLNRPPCLMRTAVELIEDTLARGCVAILARGGWRRERFLKNGQAVEGRLWERHATEELTLQFSHHTLKALIWLTADNPRERRQAWPEMPAAELTPADRFLLYLLCDAVHGSELACALRTWDALAGNLLCRLAFPVTFAEVPVPLGVDLAAPWLTGVGAAILEALQQELRQRCLETERQKSETIDWQQMQRLGQEQERTLGNLLAGLQRVGRPDLARFLLAALHQLLPVNPQLHWWVQHLTTLGPRLADRVETGRQALALVRQLATLHQWFQDARLVRFFEDGYPMAQFFMAEWERWEGNTLHERATQLLREIEPL